MATRDRGAPFDGDRVQEKLPAQRRFPYFNVVSQLTNIAALRYPRAK
jgi:hypothetical protein